MSDESEKNRKCFWTRVSKVAASFGIPEETYRKWPNRGSVPAKWHIKFLIKAPEIGVVIRPHEFISAHH